MAVSPKEAINIICDAISKEKYEILPIENINQRVCAQNIYATSSLPKFNNSAMDGYALNINEANKPLKVIDTVFAGDNKNIELKKNTCIKIMTGAIVPDDANIVVPKEDVKINTDGSITILDDVRMHQHIRFIGEDIKLNDLLIKEKELINFSKITLLASQGISHVKVYKKPNIVVFASGEELKLHYENIESHQIYNSNTPTFISRCEELGCNINFIGQAKDSTDSIKEHIKNSLDADLIITSGGVSVGDADFTKESFDQLGFETLFHGITIKPGKPTIFGKIKDTFILNLPGNPLACTLIFELFGRVIIQKLLNTSDVFPNTIHAKIEDDFSNKSGRQTILPGYFDGEYFAVSNKRSPGMVSTLNSCNCMIILHEDVKQLRKNQTVKILPINWNFFTDEYKDYLTYE